MDTTPVKKIEEENSILKEKLGFALGILDTVQILIRPSDEETLNKNIEHLRTKIPGSIKDLKTGI